MDLKEWLAPESPPFRVDPAGVVRVAKTRITLDTLVGEFLDGASPQEIASGYLTLDLADIYATLAFYLRHRKEVDEYVADGRREGAQTRAEMEQRFPPEGIRARLLSRQVRYLPPL